MEELSQDISTAENSSRHNECEEEEQEEKKADNIKKVVKSQRQLVPLSIYNNGLLIIMTCHLLYDISSDKISQNREDL